jgi:two-component system sensor histidine kinase RegB
MSDALAETQLALAKEQRLSALGTLAAAAAHELGTPLGTITVVARELSRELPPTGAVADDVRLLIAEAQRCRDILAQLSRRPEGEPDPHLHRLPAPALLDTIAAPHRRREGVSVTIETAPGRGLVGTAPPVLPHAPEIAHGLGNLVENAVDFARSRVTITVAWTVAELSIVLADDGPGFAQNILGVLGEPYISSRAESGDGMGLGVFIAKTLLERTGARVSFANRQEGGAQVSVTWARSALDEAALSPA